jgi:hypothetical protein
MLRDDKSATCRHLRADWQLDKLAVGRIVLPVRQYRDMADRRLQAFVDHCDLTSPANGLWVAFQESQVFVTSPVITASCSIL